MSDDVDRARQPSTLVGKGTKATVEDCAKDMAQAAGPEAQVLQRGQTRVSAQSGGVVRHQGRWF